MTEVAVIYDASYLKIPGCPLIHESIVLADFAVSNLVPVEVTAEISALLKSEVPEQRKKGVAAQENILRIMKVRDARITYREISLKPLVPADPGHALGAQSKIGQRLVSAARMLARSGQFAASIIAARRNAIGISVEELRNKSGSPIFYVSHPDRLLASSYSDLRSYLGFNNASGPWQPQLIGQSRMPALAERIFLRHDRAIAATIDERDTTRAANESIVRIWRLSDAGPQATAKPICLTNIVVPGRATDCFFAGNSAVLIQSRVIEGASGVNKFKIFRHSFDRGDAGGATPAEDFSLSAAAFYPTSDRETAIVMQQTVTPSSNPNWPLPVIDEKFFLCRLADAFKAPTGLPIAGRFLNAAFRGDGRVAAVAASASTTLFNLDGNGDVGKRVIRLPIAAKAIAMSDDGRLLAAGSGEGLGIWTLPDLKQLFFHKQAVPKLVSISQDGSVVVFGFDSSLLCVFGPDFAKAVTIEGSRRVGLDHRQLVAAGFNSRGDRLVTTWGTVDAVHGVLGRTNVAIWTLPACDHILTSMHSWAKWTDVDDSGRLAVTVDRDRVLRVWELNGRAMSKPRPGSPASVSPAAAS